MVGMLLLILALAFAYWLEPLALAIAPGVPIDWGVLLLFLGALILGFSCVMPHFGMGNLPDSLHPISVK